MICGLQCHLQRSRPSLSFFSIFIVYFHSIVFMLYNNYYIFLFNFNLSNHGYYKALQVFNRYIKTLADQSNCSILWSAIVDKNILLLDRPNIKPFIDILIVDLFLLPTVLLLTSFNYQPFYTIDFFLSLILTLLLQLFYCQLFTSTFFIVNFFFDLFTVDFLALTF